MGKQFQARRRRLKQRGCCFASPPVEGETLEEPRESEIAAAEPAPPSPATTPATAKTLRRVKDALVSLEATSTAAAPVAPPAETAASTSRTPKGGSSSSAVGGDAGAEQSGEPPQSPPGASAAGEAEEALEKEGEVAPAAEPQPSSNSSNKGRWWGFLPVSPFFALAKAASPRGRQGETPKKPATPQAEPAASLPQAPPHEAVDSHPLEGLDRSTSNLIESEASLGRTQQRMLEAELPAVQE